MTDRMRTALEQACQMFMYPIAKFLLSRGFRYPDFAEIAKLAFVQAAQDDSDVTANICLMTGLSRIHVRRLKKRKRVDTARLAYLTGLSAEVLSTWHQDPDYVNADGEPIAIDANRFQRLVSRVNPDLAADDVAADLIRAKSIVRLGTGLLEPRMRYFIPPEDDPRFIIRYGLRLRDLASTLFRNQDARLLSLFEATSTHFQVRTHSLPLLRNIAKQHGLQVLRSYDDWVITQSNPRKDRATRTGICFFLFQE